MVNPTMQASGIDVSLLVGTWYGIKLDENYVAKLVITEENGALLLHPFATPDSEVSDWGQAEAIPHVEGGSTTATGFQAHFRLGDRNVEFLVVNNQGVLLTQAFTSFTDGSGRPATFAKAYFRRATPELTSTTGISTGTVTGDWVNANPATTWVAGFTLTENGTIRVRGASDPVDWGEAETTAHHDKLGETYLYAEYDLEPFQASVGVISVKNLVVLNQFYRYKDGVTLDSFYREFYFRNS